jgi:hypothetical protein
VNFFLKLKSKSVSEEILDLIAEEFKRFYLILKNKLVHKLKNTENESSQLIEEIFPHNMFDDFDTKYKRNKKFQTSVEFVSPEMIELKKNESDKKSEETVIEKSFYAYVPIIKSLERTLIKNDIAKTPTSLCDTLTTFSSYRDGSFYKNHPFFCKETVKFELILFSDDYNLCDPLGPAKTKYKTNGVYYKIGNLDWVSEANPIKLVQLCFTKDIMKFGYNSVFRRKEKF